ncbi:MAG: SGNH/GDSL hydrolase family protein [Hyphomicrobiaceae bacterium]
MTPNLVTAKLKLKSCLIASFLVFAASLDPVMAAADKNTCVAPESFARFKNPLPALKRTVASGKNLHIVALGSSSTAGTGASSANNRYPRQLAKTLRKKLSEIKIRVDNYGRGGTLASHMLKRIKKKIISQTPTLVIWQTGVNDAIRKVPFDKFEKTIRDGIALLHSRSIDVVLLDPQHFPGEKKYADYHKYIALMGTVAKEMQVPVLRRYDLMKHLVTSAQFKARDLLAKDQFHLNDVSYACLGKVLGTALANSANAQ